MAKKTGRRSKYDEFISRKGLVLVEGWARDGLTDEQIAHNLGIAQSTFYKWKNEHAEFSEALKRTKEIADFEIENALFKKAKMGDTTAQIFWLKNRRPDKWREKITGDMNMKIENDGFIDALKGQAAGIFKDANIEE